MQRTKIRELLAATGDEREVYLCGWVRSRRDSKGGFSFIEINDGSCLANIQAVADGQLPNYESEILKITTGSSVAVKGKLVASQGKGQSVEVQASQVDVIQVAPDDFPIQKKRHSFEYLREIAHLRPRTNTFGAVTRVRNSLSFAIHSFFQERGFFYINTPIITTNDAEGAGELFHVTTMPLDAIPRQDGKVDFSRDFFGAHAFLTVSGQLEGEVYASALGDVYTFGPTFRAENSNTSRHLAEFWMVEPEMAFCDLAGDMDLAEAFLKYVFTRTLNECAEDMEFFAKFVRKDAVQRLQAIAESPFERITYTEAVEILKKAKKAKFEFPVEWGRDLQSEHERFLTEKHFQKPVIITDYPREIKAFYMLLNDDEKTVAAMDVLVPGVGEIIGGSQREHRADQLQQRFTENDIPSGALDWFLDLRRFGSVPHAGFGLGLERLVQFVTGMENIRDVIPFPRTPGNAKF